MKTIEIAVPKNTRLVGISSGPFTFWLEVDGVRVLLGPSNVTRRKFELEPHNYEDRTIFVDCDKSVEVQWRLEEVASTIEFPDPTPREVPLKLRQAPSLHELVARIVNQRLTEFAEDHGLETPQEADDFDIDEEELDLSKYELSVMQEEAPIISPRKKPAEPPRVPEGSPPPAPVANPPTGAASPVPGPV